MNQNKVLMLSIIFLFFTLSGCDKVKEHFKGHTHDELHAGQEIVLNKGKKWAADESTKKHVAVLRQIMKNNQTGLSAVTAENSSLLRSKLNAEVDTLFATCTMEGEAHDQLHIYLKGLLEKIAMLDSKNEKERGDAFSLISSALEMFDNYFE